MTRDAPGTACECRSCRALIVWTRTERGKTMPCDVAPSEDGQFFLFRRATFVEAVHINSVSKSAQVAHERKQGRHHSHFSTCPNADQHRRARG